MKRQEKEYCEYVNELLLEYADVFGSLALTAEVDNQLSIACKRGVSAMGLKLICSDVPGNRSEWQWYADFKSELDICNLQRLYYTYGYNCRVVFKQETSDFIRYTVEDSDKSTTFDIIEVNGHFYNSNFDDIDFMMQEATR